MRVVTFWKTAVYYERVEREARASGDKKRIVRARNKRAAYKKLCLESDDTVTGVRKGDLR